jgi:hypothetical protein
VTAADALEGRWTDIFGRDAMIHLLVMASIVAATFQGYLKDRMAGPLPYALADLCLVGAAALWFGQMALYHAPIRGPGRLPNLLLIVIALPALYLLHPGPPLPVEIAGLRGWVEFPVACLIALSVINSAGQVRAYVWLVLGLGAVTALYGIRQYIQGPEAALSVSALAQIRHGSTIMYFDPTLRTTAFRAFSTFTFPAPFAGFMVFGMLLAAGVGLDHTRSRAQRWLCLALIPLLFVGMSVSGTRAALVMLVVGLLVLGWFRGFSARQLFLVPVVFLALHVATLLTAGRVLGRFRSILAEDVAWTYVLQPMVTAARTLAEAPFGLGLGRTGVGVPFAMVQAQPPGYFIFSDGDIGRAAVEMGIFGVILLAVIVFGLLPYAARAARALRDTSAAGTAVGIGALVVGLGVIILVGSPLSTAPHGTIWWFFLGALVKLWMMESEERRWGPGDGERGTVERTWAEPLDAIRDA